MCFCRCLLLEHQLSKSRVRLQCGIGSHWFCNRKDFPRNDSLFLTDAFGWLAEGYLIIASPQFPGEFQIVTKIGHEPFISRSNLTHSKRSWLVFLRFPIRVSVGSPAILIAMSRFPQSFQVNAVILSWNRLFSLLTHFHSWLHYHLFIQRCNWYHIMNMSWTMYLSFRISFDYT